MSAPACPRLERADRGGGGCARGVTRPLCPQPLSFDGRSRLSILLLLLLLAAHLLSIQTRACSEDNRGEQADSYKMLPSRGSWACQVWRMCSNVGQKCAVQDLRLLLCPEVGKAFSFYRLLQRSLLCCPSSYTAHNIFLVVLNIPNGSCFANKRAEQNKKKDRKR